MSTKKYLTLEEAARQLSMAPDELVRLRERGEIRGFADRGTWKFRSEDVEEFSRSRDADSSPEVPIIDDKPGRKSPAWTRARSWSRSWTYRGTWDSGWRCTGSIVSHPEPILHEIGLVQEPKCLFAQDWWKFKNSRRGDLADMGAAGCAPT